jgi:hypothetical protein
MKTKAKLLRKPIILGFLLYLGSYLIQLLLNFSQFCSASKISLFLQMFFALCCLFFLFMFFLPDYLGYTLTFVSLTSIPALGLSLDVISSVSSSL